MRIFKMIIIGTEIIHLTISVTKEDLKDLITRQLVPKHEFNFIPFMKKNRTYVQMTQDDL